MELSKYAPRQCPLVDNTSRQQIDSQISSIVRESYSRLLALLASKTGDISGAEDALATALTKALQEWPNKGIPQNPQGWLLTVARNSQLDVFKSAAYRTSLELDSDSEVAVAMSEIDPEEIPDERLKLLFVCAHPAISANIRTPLMLQTVLNIEAIDIANAYVIPVSTMAQRLVRAKRKIKAAAIPFLIPEKSDMVNRLSSVLEAIYGAFSINQEEQDSLGPDNNLQDEAVYLANLMAQLMPDEPEVLGLSALLNFSMARKQAHFSIVGEFVPLEQQNMDLWNQLQIRQAEQLLVRASALQVFGRFQIEAAIQAVHCYRKISGETDWQALCQLYEGLIQLSPTIGAATGRAIAFGMAYGADAGLKCLQDIDHPRLESFQPVWVTKAKLLTMKKEYKLARQAYTRAIELTTNKAIRHFLENQKAALISPE